MTITYSEIFHSIQGEGKYTGTLGPWLRFWGCNLQCNGFGQKDPTDPSTYKLPYKDLNVDDYNSFEDLPVFEYGCDSSYTWSKKFSCLNHKGTVEEVCDEIENSMKSEHNPKGKFMHPGTYVDQHMHFTGGEPLLKRNQRAIMDIYREFKRRDNAPRFITFETNGTQELLPEFVEFMCHEPMNGEEIFFSVSPKLFSVTGEKNEKAIKPDTVASYDTDFRSDWVSIKGQLKFVFNGSDECWEELERVIREFRYAGCEWPVYLMPVGATKEDQESIQTRDVVNEAMKRGYNISGRLHAHIFGNQIGT